MSPSIASKVPAPSRRRVTTFPDDTFADAMRQSASENEGRGPSRVGRLGILTSDVGRSVVTSTGKGRRATGSGEKGSAIVEGLSYTEDALPSALCPLPSSFHP